MLAFYVQLKIRVWVCNVDYCLVLHNMEEYYTIHGFFNFMELKQKSFDWQLRVFLMW